MSSTTRTIVTLCLISARAAAQEAPATDTAAKEKELKQVSITAQKKAIETAPGKTILNVQSLVGTAGKNLLDVLRNMPGVTVDGQGNISITGKQGVLITVDGRQTYLGGDELRDFLRSITADEIAQIELMTQPPAQFDAEGNAGVINVKLRKLRKAGFNGNVALNWTKSLFENTHNNMLLNYRRKKTNWWTSLNYINGTNGVWWNQDTYLKDAANKVYAHAVLRSAPVEWYDKYNVRMGADCNYSEKMSIGFNVLGAYYANRMHSPITIDNFLNGGEIYGQRHTYEHSLRKNLTANAYAKHTFSKNSELSINLDYMYYHKHMFQDLETKASSATLNVPEQLVLTSRMPINIAVHSARADHSWTASSKLKIETGAKYSYVAVDNAAYFQRFTAGLWTDDASRTNRFLYHEHIAALYTKGNLKISERWSAQVGLRGEAAIINATQEATGEQLSRRLPALFPTAYITYKLDSVHTLELDYGRRVERPQYGMLNPFNYYTFYNTYQRGNPQLLPQYTHNLELRHSYNNELFTSVQLSAVSNTLTYISHADTAARAAYQMPVNLNSERYAYLSLTYQKNIKKWWQSAINIGCRYSTFSADYNGRRVMREGAGMYAWLSNQVTLGKWSADCFVQYAGAVYTSAFSFQRATLYSNLGVARTFLKDTATLKISMDDPFYIYRNVYYNDQPGITDNSTFLGNSRYCNVAFTYKFGANAQRRQEQARLDEAGRAGI